MYGLKLKFLTTSNCLFHTFAAPGDYIPLNTSVTIPAGSTQYLVEIQIRADEISENPESFQVILSSLSVGVLINQSVATISIISLVGKSKYSHYECVLYYLHVMHGWCNNNSHKHYRFCTVIEIICMDVKP